MKMNERAYRGEVYQIFSESKTFGTAMCRPGVIVSSDKGNEKNPIVQVLFITKTVRDKSIFVETVNEKSEAVCIMGNQLFTVHKDLIGDYLYTVSEDDMQEVDRVLRKVLDLEREEASAVETPPVVDDTDLRIELDFYKRAYEKVLGQFVDLRVEKDLAAKSEPPFPVVEEPVVELPEPEPEKIDINRCAERDLINLGFSFSVVRNITSARPFLKEDDLRIVPGVTRMAYQIAEKRITVGDVSEYLPKPKSKKKEPAPAAVEEVLDLNTVTPKECMEILGLTKSEAYKLTGYRKKHGNFTSMDQLVGIPGVFRTTIAKLEGKVRI